MIYLFPRDADTDCVFNFLTWVLWIPSRNLTTLSPDLVGKGLQLDLFKHHEIELKDKSLNRKKYFFLKVNNGIVSVWKYTGKTSGWAHLQIYNMLENKNGKYFLFKYIAFITITDRSLKVGITNAFIIKNLFCTCQWVK